MLGLLLSPYHALVQGQVISVTIGLSFDNVYELDLHTGSNSFVGSTGFSGFNSLAADSQGDFYSASTTQVVRIDPVTGAGTLAATHDVTPTNSIFASAFSPADQLYVLSRADNSVNTFLKLYTIDLLDGTSTLIGTADRKLAAMTFSGTGELYAWSFDDGLITINPSTAAVSIINPGLSTIPFLQSIAFDETGMLYGVDSSKIYSIDLADSTTTQRGTTSNRAFNGVETATFLIPEPSACAFLLGVCALVSAAYRGARRSRPARAG